MTGVNSKRPDGKMNGVVSKPISQAMKTNGIPSWTLSDLTVFLQNLLCTCTLWAKRVISHDVAFLP